MSVEVSEELRAWLARAFRVQSRELVVDERWTDHRNFAEVFRVGDQCVRVDFHMLDRLEPKPDPYLDGLMAIALALHDASKRRDREAAAVVRAIGRAGFLGLTDAP